MGRKPQQNCKLVVLSRQQQLQSRLNVLFHVLYNSTCIWASVVNFVSNQLLITTNDANDMLLLICSNCENAKFQPVY